jgi:hypothetical protein
MLASSQAGPVLDARFSPDGRQVAFVQNAELHVVDPWKAASPAS